MHGFTGNIVVADLSAGTITIDHPTEAMYRRYLGGAALAMDYVLREVPPAADPLGPENVLVFAVGPMTGTAISGQSRMSVNAKSPLTGVIGDAQVGGFFPAELKFAGFDAIVVKGKAEHPTYLWIEDGKVELRDASAYWGLGTGDLQERVESDLGDNKIQLMAIGQAGENLVKYACIVNMMSRAAGRTGLGAVMGSKNLKFIACRGHGKVSVANPERLKALTQWGAKNVRINLAMAGLQKYGTAETVLAQQAVGGLPTHNWDSGVFAEAEEISGERMYETIHLKNDTCYACAVRCKRVVQEENRGVEGRYGGPEYENLATLGSYCMVSDLGAIALANQLCNIHGMDPIAVGATIGWAMDAFAKGEITTADTGGLEIAWGDAEMMLHLTEAIARREGFGNVLAEGMRGAADVLGRGHDLLTEVKGNALPAHMPQVKRSLALIYAVNPFGADHQSHEHDPGYTPFADEESLRRLSLLGLDDPQDQFNLSTEKVRFALETQKFYSMVDSASLCQFVYGPSWQLYGPDHLVEALQAVTGWDDLTVEELQEIGGRKLTMQRWFNARDGVGRDKDTLPKKMFKPLAGGPSDGLHVTREELSAALDTYYEMAGWDTATGYPTPASLAHYGIDTNQPQAAV